MFSDYFSNFEIFTFARDPKMNWFSLLLLLFLLLLKKRDMNIA